MKLLIALALFINITFAWDGYESKTDTEIEINDDTTPIEGRMI